LSKNLSSKLLVLLNYCFDTEILNRTIPSLAAQMIPDRVITLFSLARKMGENWLASRDN